MKILARHTPDDHLKTATSVRGTSTVVGEAFSEASIPTLVLHANEMPSMTDKSKNVIRVPLAEADKIVKTPMLVRLRSNNSAEVIVKVKTKMSTNATHVSYDIEWTLEGIA